MKIKFKEINALKINEDIHFYNAIAFKKIENVKLTIIKVFKALKADINFNVKIEKQFIKLA